MLKYTTVALLFYFVFPSVGYSQFGCGVASGSWSCDDETSAGGYANTSCSGCYTEDPPEIPTTEATFYCANIVKTWIGDGNDTKHATQYDELDPTEPGSGNVPDYTAYWYIYCGYQATCADECAKEVENNMVTVVCVVSGGGDIEFQSPVLGALVRDDASFPLKTAASC